MREYRVCRSTRVSAVQYSYAEFGAKRRNLSVSNGRLCSGAREKIVGGGGVIVVIIIVVVFVVVFTILRTW